MGQSGRYFCAHGGSTLDKNLDLIKRKADDKQVIAKDGIKPGTAPAPCVEIGAESILSEPNEPVLERGAALGVEGQPKAIDINGMLKLIHGAVWLPGWLWRTLRRCDVTEMMNAHGRPFR